MARDATPRKCAPCRHANKADDEDASVAASEASEGTAWLRGCDLSDWAYAPHTLLAMLAIVVATLLLLRYGECGGSGGTSDAAERVVTHVKLGLAAMCVVFVGFGALHLPDSLLVRPHPIVWRAVLSCGVVYVVALTFLLFQDVHMAKRLMGYYDASLRVPLPERAYAEDCHLLTSQWPYVRALPCLDAFIVAHALGYVVKTLIVRDWRIVTCVSLGFELVEVTLQHVLPNFRECWWDHIVLDVLLCNGGGTLLGLLLLRRLRAMRYDWTSAAAAAAAPQTAPLTTTTTTSRHACRDCSPCRRQGVASTVTHVLLARLTPRRLDVYDSDVLVTPTRFVHVAALVLLMLLQELNCFTMKAILDIPPTHHLVTARLLLWAAVALPATREYYDFVTRTTRAQCEEDEQRGGRACRQRQQRRRGARLRTTAWVMILGLLLETLWIGKMACEGGYFREPAPVYVALPWLAALVLFALWFVVYFGFARRGRRVRWCCACGCRVRAARCEDGRHTSSNDNHVDSATAATTSRRSVTCGCRCWWCCLVRAAVHVPLYASLACLLGLFCMALPDVQLGRASFVRAVAPYEARLLFWR